MKNKLKRLLALFLMMAFVLLSGCQQTNEDNMDESVSADTEDNSIDVGSEDTDVIAEIESIDKSVEYAYSDKIFDRSATEGRFACYYFRSNYIRPKPIGNSSTGDAALLIAPDGTTMLIDFNMAPATAHVVSYLQRLGINKLDYVMASHTDMDHCGGYNALLEYIEVEHIYISDSPSYKTTNHKAGRFVAKAVEKGASYTILKAGMEIDFGGVNMKVLWPTPDMEWPASPTAVEVNDASLVVKFTYGKSSFLFSGDINSAQEIELAEMYGDELQADVLKMNHHGSKTSNSQKWLKTVNPKLTCGMAGAVSSSEVLERYMYMDIPFTLSVLDGATVVSTDGDGVYDVQVEKEREDTYFGVLPTTDGYFQIK
ncbi:MAG: MBL fold metallo-hydrolase [Tyzzerella sp.]|nr:MBL fold metallo-hydrolase [Tyzzerella sp.]